MDGSNEEGETVPFRSGLKRIFDEDFWNRHFLGMKVNLEGVEELMFFLKK